MAFLPLLRLVTFIATLVCAIIVLGLAAHLTSLTEELDFFFSFAAMAIAAAVLTIITLPIMIGVDFVRRGAFPSMVLVELIWLFILWILWISAAGLASQADQFEFGDGSSCDFSNLLITADEAAALAAGCHEFAAIEAFSFLAWILLMGYNITLFVCAIIGHSRGNRTWFSTVGDGLLTRRDGAPVSDKQTPVSTGGAYSTTAPSTMQYPPQQQYAQPMTAQTLQAHYNGTRIGTPPSHFHPISIRSFFPQLRFPLPNSLSNFLRSLTPSTTSTAFRTMSSTPSTLCFNLSLTLSTASSMAPRTAVCVSDPVSDFSWGVVADATSAPPVTARLNRCRSPLKLYPFNLTSFTDVCTSNSQAPCPCPPHLMSILSEPLKVNPIRRRSHNIDFHFIQGKPPAALSKRIRFLLYPHCSFPSPQPRRFHSPDQLSTDNFTVVLNTLPSTSSSRRRTTTWARGAEARIQSDLEESEGEASTSISISNSAPSPLLLEVPVITIDDLISRTSKSKSSNPSSHRLEVALLLAWKQEEAGVKLDSSFAGMDVSLP
ncbi:hypothetical protein BT96DRAFT_989358 [Gymnopus androsaceus JB14]|uniref:MARVEL domain-containing protein n=1 Tax=Gymnopus androsaceus JB14 TaxID=1447944 RepID=A0A6A4I1B1_9AGAR|nr:hypothetical protein BT96DRAFT_989358 [Gymnopus androsaceus JB14]